MNCPAWRSSKKLVAESFQGELIPAEDLADERDSDQPAEVAESAVEKDRV